MTLCVETGEDGVPFVQLGQYKLRLDMEELDETYRERSKLELRETPDVVEDALIRLKELLEDEKDLYVPTDDDTFLFKFLRPCKFYPDSAFKLMKRYYKFKHNHPDFSLNLMPTDVKHVFQEEVVQFLPCRCGNGTRMMIVNVGAKWNTKMVSLQYMFRAAIIALEIAMCEPKTQVAGVHVILDMKGLTLHHIWQFGPSIAKTILDFVQRCVPVRLKGIHVVNQPFIFQTLFAIFKPFLDEKLKKRLFFHGTDRKSFHRHIAKEFLPEIFEGTLEVPDYPGDLLAELMCRYQKEFEYSNSMGYYKERKC